MMKSLMMGRRQRWAVLLALLAVLSIYLPVLAGCRGTKAEIAIFTTCDVHGNLLPFEESIEGEIVEVGGIPRIAGEVARLRTEYDGSLLLSAGDDFSGAFCRFFGGEPAYGAMSTAGYDVFTPGNHEFTQGAGPFLDALEYASFNVVCANLDFGDDPRAEKISDNVLKNVAGVDVGVFGLITPDLMRVSAAGDSVILEPDLAEVARFQVEDLKKQGADLVVALTHAGVEVDREIARQVEGIDVIVGGHDHQYIYETVAGPGGETIIVHDGFGGIKLGVLSLDYDNGLEEHRWETILMDDTVAGDPEIESYLLSFVDRYQEEMSIAAGESGTDLDATWSSARAGESNLANLMTDSWNWWFENQGEGADFTFITGGSIRGDSIYPAGPITYGTIAEVQPFDATVFEVELSGSQVLQALEVSASAVWVEGETTPEERRTPTGGFLQVSGMRVVYDMSRRPFSAVYDERELVSVDYPGSRVESVLVPGGSEWVPLDENRTYRAYVNSWLAEGGDGHYVFTQAASSRDTCFLVTEILLDYLEEKSPVAPIADGRIIIKNL